MNTARHGPGEVVAVWALVALAALAVVVTYARLPPADLYHTSVDGLAGGLGRTLVLLNYPTALVAVALVGICADRLLPSRPVAVAAIVAVALCLIVAVPGVVDQDDLDAKPINALPAVGVAIAIALTVLAVRRPVLAPRLTGDPVRIGLAVVLAVLAVPWLFAETGFYGPDPILADEVPRGETIAAVHLGHHHGTDGVLLAVAALLLTRTLPAFRRRRRAGVVSAYLALMLAYGAANALQDFWLEQIVKRGWTDAEIPSVLRPDLDLAWAAILAAAVVVELAWLRPERRRRRS
jgi:hypothetical protein